MFEQVVIRPRRRALKSVLVVGSAVVHAGIIASLAVAAMWHVERVSLGPDRGDIAIAGPKPPVGATSLPAGAKLQELKKPPKIQVRDVVQPPAVRPEPTPPVSTGGGDPSTTGTGTGGPPEPPGLPPCPQEPCVTDGPPDPPEPVVVKPKDPPPRDPPILPPTLARGLRESGDERILPSRTTQLAMVHDGKNRVTGSFRLCVSEGGAVTSVRTIASTGYPDYDQALVDGMRGWHYRPYLVLRPDRPDEPARPTAMCTVQTFIYRITN